jgi:mRNA interferase MazF
MSHYTRGDVVLAPVPFEERGGVKTRPAVVVFTTAEGKVYVCPVSSKPSTDIPSLPISLDDFFSGGLDLFSESYVLTSRVSVIGSGAVIGKRGRLTDECAREIVARIPENLLPHNSRAPQSSRSRSIR